LATYPQKLGRYILERRLAAGGMAEVFLARQSGPEGFEKVCVVKRMLPHLTDDEVFVSMFLDEARLAARLTHPNIAQIFDFGRNEDAYYLAMEYVAGSNLHWVVDDHARRGAKMPLPAVLKVVALACQGLDFAHNATDEAGKPLQIIHRDISPHNIMLSKTGDVKLIDFGIAKASTGLHLTKAGTLKGKYAYMAPEQVMGKPLDRRTDIYAMGLVLWELLANRPAIIGDSEASLMGAAARREFQAIETVRSDVPPEVRAVLERALAKELTGRYDSAAQMADELEDWLTKQGVRVKQSDLAALMTASTATTGVGPVLATPSPPAPGDATNVDDATKAEAPAAPPARKTQPPKPAAVTAPEAPVMLEAPPRKMAPVLAAVTLVLAASGATVFALLRPSAAVERPANDSLVVPPPPEKTLAVKAPEVVPPPPVAPPPVEETPAPPPVVEEKPEKPKPVAAKTKPKPVKEKPEKPAPAPVAETPKPAVAATGKGTVTLRVLPYAEVFRDGTSLGVTPLKPQELDPGKYEFRFVNPETKKSETKKVTVSAGQQQTLKIDLR